MSPLRLEKLQDIPILLDLYGGLLTDKQRQALSLCYEEDCTLAEIAAQHKSSRQAAFDLLQRGEAQLRDYEACLGLAKKEQERQVLADELRREIRAMAHSSEAQGRIEELLCRL